MECMILYMVTDYTVSSDQPLVLKINLGTDVLITVSRSVCLTVQEQLSYLYVCVQTLVEEKERKCECLPPEPPQADPDCLEIMFKLPNDTRVKRRFLFSQSLAVKHINSYTQTHTQPTLRMCFNRELTYNFFPFSFLGNPRLCFFLKRVTGEIPDLGELSAPCAAVFAHGGAAEPSDTKGSRSEPLRGALRAGPHRRLTLSPKKTNKQNNNK